MLVHRDQQVCVRVVWSQFVATLCCTVLPVVSVSAHTCVYTHPWGSLTLKVSHELCGTAVEGVDDHLAVNRASDLNTPVNHARGRRGPLPGWVRPDVCGFWQEVCVCMYVEGGTRRKRRQAGLREDA